MHADEADIDPGLVRALVRGQFPAWAERPVRPVDSGGTVNAIYRLGDDLAVRLPLTEGGVSTVALEARWLPALAPLLPVPIPEVVATGEPGEGYPFTWAVHRWIEGETLREGRVAEPDRVARELGAFVAALRRVELAGGPAAHRTSPLAKADAEVRDALAALAGTDEPIDRDATLAAWEAALAAGEAPAPSWIHSDLMPSNLLGGAGLAAVIDFGTVGLGDPACDLIPAWNLLPAAARGTFRRAVGVDDATWARGRGWALSMALVQLPYYRETNPVISANARYVIREVLSDQRP